MILTREFLLNADACQEAYKFVVENNLINGDYDNAIIFCANNNKQEFVNWLTEQKKTEYYVKNNGSILTMGAYQVFNPLTGVHTRYETEEEAKQALVVIAQEILNQYCPTVIQELSNENGDTTWIPTTMNKTLVIS